MRLSQGCLEPEASFLGVTVCYDLATEGYEFIHGKFHVLKIEQLASPASTALYSFLMTQMTGSTNAER